MVYAREEDLKAGRWYALGFIPLDALEPDWGGAQLLKYEGGAIATRSGCWVNEEGEPVERIWDPVLQTWVAPGSADGFYLQGDA